MRGILDRQQHKKDWFLDLKSLSSFNVLQYMGRVEEEDKRGRKKRERGGGRGKRFERMEREEGYHSNHTAVVPSLP